MDWDDLLPNEIIARWERWRTELLLLEKVKLNCMCQTAWLWTFIPSWSTQVFGSKRIRNWPSLISSNSQLQKRSSCEFPYGQVTSNSYQADIYSPYGTDSGSHLSVNVTEWTRLREFRICLLHGLWSSNRLHSNNARRFHVYVGNRVQHIRDRSDPEQWHHVPGKDDPADEASHSLTASQLLNNKRWLSGPEFRCTTA